ncbi:MAG: twin-arginine translocase TatA/TatE family subunit [Bacteroidetes bacterium]|nr:MAG: twin-arginine translocase TatA/TatE family subunit [Bacteroidota bacterium]
MFGNLGATEILLIAVCLIVLFGARRIPELARGIGKGIKDFKRELRSDNDANG